VTTWIILSAALVTVAAAVRSTWSPCGLSMLASITPLSEVGRGHRYRTTATWFIAGSVTGGLTLGLVMAALTVGVDALGLTARLAVAVALVAASVAVASDVGIGGFHLPVHHRQVNERWLDQYRPWVYGAGFGWQIGTGLATYIMTATLYLSIVLAALSGAPGVALGLGALFGLVRGLSVLLGRRITSAQTLAAFHQRFFHLGPKIRRGTITVELVAAGLLGGLLSPWAALALVAASLGWVMVRAAVRPARRQPTAPSTAGEGIARVASSGRE
jgi:hypothetical protein